MSGVASEKIAAALRDSLPRYDPAQRVAAERSEQTAKSAGDRSPALNHAAAELPVEPAPSRPPGGVTDSQVVQLAPFTVRGSRPPPAIKLPRLSVAKDASIGADTSDPFLTPAERARRLRKKHLNVLTMLLNPAFLGGGMAGESEERERYAGQLNGIADEIELAAAAGAKAEELKELRELYLKLYMVRPK